MRAWLWTLAVLLVCVLSAAPALAQAHLDCAAVPEAVCLDDEVLALERDRLTLVEQISASDPQSAVTAGEQLWLEGLGACGETIDCYRAAYLTHNQALRQSLPATPEPPLEEPPDAAEPPAEDATPARDEPRDGGGATYAPTSLPGWGFFVALGLTLLILFWLLRARARNRDALHEDKVRLRDWR